MTNTIERSAMRKTYLRLLPLAVVSYFLAYIDRINVSFAGLTMRDDLNMSAALSGLRSARFTGATRSSSRRAISLWKRSVCGCGSPAS